MKGHHGMQSACCGPMTGKGMGCCGTGLGKMGGMGMGGCCGGGHGMGGGRKFFTKEEKKAHLEAYRDNLKQELAGVEEVLKNLE